MTQPGYTTSFTVDRTPATVFAAVTDVRGWWSRSIAGATERLGDEFVFAVPGVHRSHMKLTDVIPDRKVVWLARDNTLTFVEDPHEWNGTEIHFDITEKGDGTELRFTHVGLVPQFECYGACSGGWSFYVHHSLYNLITTGTGQPSELPGEVTLREEAAARASADPRGTRLRR